MKRIEVHGLALALAVAVVAALLSVSSAALAHTFGAAGAGFTAGLMHPFGGLDHLLAMLAVGLWAAQQRGRAAWALSGAFVVAMAAGAALALAGVALPAVEAGLAASVLVVGLVVAAALRPSPAAAGALAGLFALWHGHAHGGELPMAASPWL
ncbi:MAG TPA: HupE/UreJ family protein, partial [Dongiaceae bacterium]|nr:HupE/UreJ family protein [Dongiaceae bacterium]